MAEESTESREGASGEGTYRIIIEDEEAGLCRILPVEADPALMGKGDKNWAQDEPGTLYRITPVSDEAAD